MSVMKYVLMRDDKPIGVYSTSTQAMYEADRIVKGLEGSWFTVDISPAHHHLTIPKFSVYGVKT